MKASTVILCECSGRWAAAILRNLPATAQLVQVRGRDQCLAHVTDAPTSIVALEVTSANAQEIVELASHVARRYPWSTIVVLAGEEMVDCQQLAREAGAAHVFSSPRDLGGWRQTVERHFARIPLEPLEFAESVWHSLPWKSAATA
jgi:hypothetical protein